MPASEASPDTLEPFEVGKSFCYGTAKMALVVGITDEEVRPESSASILFC